jgi:uncharacterized protein
MTAVKKYRPRIASLLQLCESNYLLLSRLLAGKMSVGESRDFALSAQLNYQLSINEVTRYTSLITIEQQTNTFLAESTHKLHNMLRPSMVVRLYHDARMAEVIANQDIKHVKPRYDYPNDKMHLPDEKQQISQFLKEWLQLCLHHGHVNQIVFKGEY